MRMRRSFAVIACLALLLATAYTPLRECGFVDHDDNVYVFENPQVTGGLSRSGFRWAFTTFHAGNWHPLTWISHQGDVSAFGLRPFGHHLTSFTIHAASTALLFLLLQSLTGLTAPSALVGALFAIHPLHVESVAWVSERKDVLSAFFLLLTIRAYVSWLRTSDSRRYLLALATFVLSLLSKPMGITLPFVLLLLDYWPLGRLRAGPRAATRGAGGPAPPPGALLIEKIPFFVLAAAAIVVTVIAQRHGSMFYPLPVLSRLGNALAAYLQYVLKFFWPARLTAFYPHPEAMLPLGELLLFAALFAGATAAAILAARRRPWLFVGWFWYLGTLLPVIGLVQVGSQAYADRYTYVPLIGFSVALAWGAFAQPRSRRRTAVASAAALVWVCVLLPATHRQVGHWRDSRALFSHMLLATERNWLAHNGLGITLGREGRFAEAAEHFRWAVHIQPSFSMGWSNLGNALSGLRDPEAVSAFEEAIRLQPDYADAYYNLGRHYTTLGDIAGAARVRRRLEIIGTSPASPPDRHPAKPRVIPRR